MRMRALKALRYGGRSYRAGDELEMRDSHANTYRVIKKAEPVSAPPAKASGTYRRRDMVAEQPAAAPSEPPTDEAIDIPNFRTTERK